jgi:hypothetical protein
MTSTLLLRIASGLTLLHAVLHTIGGVFGKPAPGAEATVALMQANQFPVMGSMRTYWDFYHGMGLAGSISMVAEAVVFWQLGELAKSDAGRLRPILATFALAYLVMALNSAAYFFAGPVIAEILIAACLGLAMRSR